MAIFDCKVCPALRDEVSHLRSLLAEERARNADLHDRYMAVADPAAQSRLARQREAARAVESGVVSPIGPVVAPLTPWQVIEGEPEPTTIPAPVRPLPLRKEN